MKYYTNCDMHWENGGNFSFQSFPKSVDMMPLPKATERVVFLSKYRYYQNTCTASYSFAWKTWAQWEHDIDWAAMNGYNLPLAFTGQEIVWQALWRSYGVSDTGLEQYFSGPAFLTWQRMANIRAFAGPLSDSWINQQADLQRNILQRYMDLGMTPVLPAFNGVVPEEMVKLYPSANITQLPSWVGFPENYTCNYILSSTDPLFVEIGSAFIKLQQQIFGTPALQTHIYNADTFNENKPASNSKEYLSSASAAVYQSIQKADPQGVWLMQGWLFVNDREFWTDQAIANYLSGVPDDGMIVLDLSSEDLPVWQKIAANNKPFLWCMLHNYGGSRALYGDLGLLSSGPRTAHAQVSSLFLGTGLTMEAIDQNPVVYEFMSEVAFHRDEELDPSKWVEQYAVRRYGLQSQDTTTLTTVLDAWRQLLKNNYMGESPVCHHPCYRRSIATLKPDWSQFQDKSTAAGPLVDVWEKLMAAGLSDENGAYAYDLVDVGRQVLVNLFYDYFLLAQNAYTHSDAMTLKALSSDMLSLLFDWDALLSSHPSYLLGRWIADARAWAKDSDEADLFDYNARNQITLWGDQAEIDDYAAKHWGGLARNYYLRRWQLFLQSSIQALDRNETLNQEQYNSQELDLGQTFCRDYSHVFPTAPMGSTTKLSHFLQEKYGNGYESAHGYSAAVDTDSDANLVATPMWTTNLKQLQRLCDASPTCQGFSSEGLLKTDLTSTYSKSGVTLFIKNKCALKKCSLRTRASWNIA